MAFLRPSGWVLATLVIEELCLSLDGVAFKHDFTRLLADADAGLLPAKAGLR